jgi:putative MFS transporter
LGLTPAWTGLLGGASLLGLFGGALIAGLMADRFGRRPIFVYNMLILSVVALLQGVAETREQLLVLRVVIGFLLGTDYVVSKTLVTEFTPRRLRGRLVGSLSVAWAAGFAAAFCVGIALLGTDPQAWRWMLITSAVPCLLVLPLRFTMPESPLWLARRGLHAKAAVVVRDTLGAGVKPPDPTTLDGASGGNWRRLLSPQLRTHTLVACAFFTCQVIPYFAIGTFITQLLSAMHLKSNYVGGLIYNLALLGGAIAGVLAGDRLPRRLFLIGSFYTASAAMLILVVWTSVPTLAMCLLFAAFAGVLSAASNLLYIYLPELFPTDLRASGIGVAVAVSRIGSAVSTFLAPILVANYGVRMSLSAAAVVLAIGGIICEKWAPETRNVPLAELDAPAPQPG